MPWLWKEVDNPGKDRFQTREDPPPEPRWWRMVVMKNGPWWLHEKVWLEMTRNLQVDMIKKSAEMTAKWGMMRRERERPYEVWQITNDWLKKSVAGCDWMKRKISERSLEKRVFLTEPLFKIYNLNCCCYAVVQEHISSIFNCSKSILFWLLISPLHSTMLHFLQVYIILKHFPHFKASFRCNIFATAYNAQGSMVKKYDISSLKEMLKDRLETDTGTGFSGL